MVSAGGRQRIVLTLQKVVFENNKVPTGFAKYVEEEIDQLLQSFLTLEDV